MRCHRLCMLRDGRRAAVGTPGELIGALAGRVVEVRVQPIDEAIAALAAAPEVASITQLGETAHVLLAPGEAPGPEAALLLRHRLEDQGFADVSAAPGSAALEDVFVALLRGERLDGRPEREA
ncbi:MAG TPA: hypothetical protein VLC53_16645 [Myxococcota bacterium]|nr:hypothetical protein [Myxococcota bacterium]